MDLLKLYIHADDNKKDLMKKYKLKIISDYQIYNMKYMVLYCLIVNCCRITQMME